MQYPDKTQIYGCQGTEVIKFSVNAWTEVTNVKIVNGVCPEIDDELIRVLESTNGMWKLGLKDGIPVSMEQEVSVVFSLSDNPKITSEKFHRVASSCFNIGSESFFEKGKSRKTERLFTKGIKYLPFDQSL